AHPVRLELRDRVAEVERQRYPVRLDMVAVEIVAALDVLDRVAVLTLKIDEEQADAAAATDRFLHDQVQHHRGILAAGEADVGALGVIEGKGDSPTSRLQNIDTDPPHYA